MADKFFAQWKHELDEFDAWKDVRGRDVPHFNCGFESEEEAYKAVRTLPRHSTIFYRVVSRQIQANVCNGGFDASNTEGTLIPSSAR